eukprot:Hpha_TRINITY_DN29805_c0_g1::TRINITY_DN29805_c0_g1_i1::g.2878::m.2878
MRPYQPSPPRASSVSPRREPSHRRVYGYRPPSSLAAPTKTAYATARRIHAHGPVRRPPRMSRLIELARPVPHRSVRLAGSRPQSGYRREPHLCTSSDETTVALRRMYLDDCASRGFSRSAVYKSPRQELREYAVRQQLLKENRDYSREYFLKGQECLRQAVELEQEKEIMEQEIESLGARLRVVDRRLNQINESRADDSLPNFCRLHERQLASSVVTAALAVVCTLSPVVVGGLPSHPAQSEPHQNESTGMDPKLVGAMEGMVTTTTHPVHGMVSGAPEIEGLVPVMTPASEGQATPQVMMSPSSSF